MTPPGSRGSPTSELVVPDFSGTQAGYDFPQPADSKVSSWHARSICSLILLVQPSAFVSVIVGASHVGRL